MIEAADTVQLQLGHKAISVLLSYALILEKSEQQEMLNVVLGAAMASDPREFMWHHIKPFMVSKEAKGDVVHRVRALGDLGLLKSYLLFLWSGSGWSHTDDWSGGLAEMQISIQEDFSGIGTGYHRDDLIKWLDHILEQINSAGPDDITIQPAKERYGELRRLLLEVDGEAVKIFSHMPPWLIIHVDLLTPTNVYRISPDIHVQSAPPMLITLYLGWGAS